MEMLSHQTRDIQELEIHWLGQFLFYGTNLCPCILDYRLLNQETLHLQK